MVEHRRAIMAGGAGGIGGAICRRLAAERYRVVVPDIISTNLHMCRMPCVKRLS